MSITRVGATVYDGPDNNIVGSPKQPTATTKGK